VVKLGINADVTRGYGAYNSQKFRSHTAGIFVGAETMGP